MTPPAGGGPGKGAGRGRSKPKGPQSAGRGRTERLRSAKRRKPSSARWLRRQLGDAYVAEARHRGLRSRAAFKLIELDHRFRFLKPGLSVVDLGAAPGGWTLVAADRVNSTGASRGRKGRVIGLDVADMDPVPGAVVIQCDFMDEAAPEKLKDALGGAADVVLSDMAAPATGHAATDHLRVVALLEAAFDFATDVLAPGGVFVGKVLKGGTEGALLREMKRRFRSVRYAKPPASRKESPETYVIATGFRK